MILSVNNPLQLSRPPHQPYYHPCFYVSLLSSYLIVVKMDTFWFTAAVWVDWTTGFRCRAKQKSLIHRQEYIFHAEGRNSIFNAGIVYGQSC